MDLIIVDAEFMWDLSLLTHHILNLAHTLLIQQTISLPYRQAQWFHDRVEVSRDGDQTRMTRHCSIHSSDLCSSLSARCGSMRLEDRISPSPAESNGANLVSARCGAQGVDETVENRLDDALAMLDEPGAQSGGDDGRILGLVRHTQRFLRFKVGFDIIEEGDGQRVALVQVRDVAVEAAFGSVFVGEKADVGEFPAKY